jgi:5-methylthioadenosine/S-adenosylhomocysteine deaminase
MNILLKNIGIMTVDETNSYIKNGNIGIRDNIIEFVENHAEHSQNFIAQKIIDGTNKLVMPGLVNAHTHSPMTILRNCADDLPLEEWLFQNIIPKEALLTEEDVYWGALLGMMEMIKSGTTCFADMYLHMDEVAKAVLESGIRANLSKGPLVSGFRGKPGISVDVEGCTQYFKEWDHQGDGRIKTCVEIHSVYLYDEPSLRETAALAKQMNAGIHIHILETAGEMKSSQEKYGMTSIEACEKFGIFDVPVFAAHCVHVSDRDLEIMKARSVNVVHNPSSNLKLGSGIAKIPEMLGLGLNVCLGTDGAASNNNLNMFEEMNLTALLHKGVRQNPLLINAGQVLRMATINGAKALNFESEIGTIEKGKKADLTILNLDKPHLCPLNNPMSAVVYASQGSDVDTVIVNGNILMENRELKTMDEERIQYQVRKIAGRIF